MSDIFISCARRDRADAAAIADSLRTRGYDVSIEKGAISKINPFKSGKSDDESAPLIATLWTPYSIKSDRIVARAEDARCEQRHIGVLLESSLELPLSFEPSKGVDMTGARPEWEELDALCEKIEAMSFLPRTRAATATGTGDERISASDAEGAIWYKINSADSVSGYKFYLKQYGRKGAFADEARARIKALTTWWYRFKQMLSSNFAKGLALLALVIGGAALYANFQKGASAGDAEQVAALETRNAELEAALREANTSRVNLIASMSDKVSRERYAQANERATTLERQLASVSDGSADSSNGTQPASFLEREQDLSGEIYIPSVESMKTSALDPAESLPDGESDETVAAAAEDFGGDKIASASVSELTCTVAGDEGVIFGSTCWPRSISKLALDGFGVETATSLEPLTELSALEDLDVAGAVLSDLGPIASMTKLRRLNIAGTSVESIEPIASLDGLVALDLAGTAVTDLSPLKDMTELTTLCPPSESCITDDGEKVQKYLDEHAR